MPNDCASLTNGGGTRFVQEPGGNNVEGGGGYRSDDGSIDVGGGPSKFAASSGRAAQRKRALRSASR